MDSTDLARTIRKNIQPLLGNTRVRVSRTPPRGHPIFDDTLMHDVWDENGDWVGAFSSPRLAVQYVEMRNGGGACKSKPEAVFVSFTNDRTGGWFGWKPGKYKSCPRGFVSAIKFEDGSVWDAGDGWEDA